ncbi:MULTISPECIES: hypothetical protein [Brachybacterium]|uniref:Uncharacterized protein n=1 Tax=Brachybacterium alimentarium TaxID=47845 RepID=A0A2A3YIL2_9MICO|nr:MULTISPECIES: hypothetical protein [Brachybacterium]PCC32197.1 hypothetical protein CIK71_12110 [Brachybacterium alimentarium]PCC39069.1 hypothetical protein CIK66_10760 [Brachybacterium alimentarium]RCS64449.1 hypothetical protein CIK73_14980 [Brachybacterium alimentarium]RCS64647.1 hypothetical protein CIK81_08550 [Brachybacterium sp. JB7]RCS65448.1 hypothetical protein CIK68_16660 [Brachybacterium alimentarium]
MSTADRPDPEPDDIDAEFARLTEGLSLDEVPLTVEDVLSEGGEGEDEEELPTIAVVATSVATSRALAGAIRLGREARTDGIDIPTGSRTHDTGTGAIAVGPLAETAAHDLAAIASTALQRNGIVLFWRRGDRMTATRYKGGERGEDISPAIVLGAVDDLVEELLLGATALDELDEGIDPSTLTRAEALSWIAGKGKGKGNRS